MYYMAYGNNDYRDYVMAHSLGEWKSRATKYIDKIVGPGGKVRYIYDTAKTGIQKHVTGSYYKNKASGAMSAYKQHKTSSDMMSRAVSEANKGYSRSLAGRANAARSRVGSALRKAGYSIKNASRSLIERGKKLVTRVIHTVKKRLGMYNDKHKSDNDSYGRTHSEKPMSKEQLKKKLKRAKMGARAGKNYMYFDKDNPGKAGKGGRKFYNY